jgi:hypothetical protein
MGVKLPDEAGARTFLGEIGAERVSIQVKEMMQVYNICLAQYLQRFFSIVLPAEATGVGSFSVRVRLQNDQLSRDLSMSL